jgi:hypothetical protein
MITKKLARRWLNQNSWNISKYRLGHFKEDGQFHRKYRLCTKIIEGILFRKFT